MELWQPYLAGVLHGDGWCTALTIGLRCKDEDFSMAFCNAINAGFRLGKHPARDERGYWLVRVGNKSGRFSHLRGYLPTKDVERAAWLRGLFDSEGNVKLTHQPYLSENAYNRRVAIFSTSLPTLGKASVYLDALNIPNSIKPWKNSAGHKGDKPVYALGVLRQEGFSAFARLVGSSILRKHQTLLRMVDTYQDRFDYCSRGGTKGVATRLARAASGGVY